jgi:putative sigma-54 modulation protein
MDCDITGRNVELNDEIRDYISKRMVKLDRFYSRVYGCEIVLEEEKERNNVEIILILKRNRLIAKESSPDLFSSIDMAVESITKQLRRLRDRLKTRRRRKVMQAIMKPVRRIRRR